MAHVTVGDDAVHIRLELLDEVLAFHGGLTIPLAHIQGVSTDPVPAVRWHGERFGTDLPGIITAGTFVNWDGHVFYDFRDPDRCVTIRLDHEHYNAVVVQVDGDKEAVAREIEAARARLASGAPGG